jgi:hypothetical protein
MKENQKLIGLNELAKILGKSSSAIRYHMRMGRIKPTAKFGRTCSFDTDEVLRQLKREIK